MPPQRQPLRQRCNVQLSVCTTLSADDTGDLLLESRGSSRYCTKRKGGPGVRDSRCGENAKISIPQPSPPPACCRPTKEFPPSKAAPHSFLELTPPSSPVDLELQHLHEIIPFVSLAVCSSPASDPLPKHIKDEYTHVLRMTYAPVFRASTQSFWGTGIFVLNLSVPAPHAPESKINVRVTKSGRRVKHVGPFPSPTPCTSMSPSQLLLARDFLSLALPYYSCENPPSPSVSQKQVDKVHVLIIAPTTVDALSVAICYLAWASEESAATIIGYVDEEEEVSAPWRYVFGNGVKEYSEGVEKIESTARQGE